MIHYIFKKDFFCKFAATYYKKQTHMKKLLLIILAIMPFVAIAKDNKKNDNSNPKYLEGAITLKDDKVVFEEKIKVPSMTKEELYNTMLDWAEKRFISENNLTSKVVYTNEEKGEIVASAEEYIVFSSSALSLDRTRIYYYFYIEVENGICNLTMNRIKYWYDENRDGGERYTAEEWITDDMALNKKKTKLTPICGKFRRETIDLKDELFTSVKNCFGLKLINNNTSTTTQQTSENVLGKVSVSQLPDNLNEVAAKGKITITSGNKETEIGHNSWGGFGKMFNKDVAYILIDKNLSDIYKSMEENSDYKVSFYSSEKASKAEIIVECKKNMTQTLSSEELKSLNQNIDTSKEYIMYICEVTSAEINQ